MLQRMWAVGCLWAVFWAGMGGARAQQPPSGTSTDRTLLAVSPSPSTPRLMVDEAGQSRPMVVEAVETTVVISGLLAETTTKMVFRNPHDRILEGNLHFPLPEGATISGFGLDVDGQLVDGVIVEKNAARVAFETEVRRTVDPGLAEWVRGNNFQTRVYPIPAGGTRQVMVRYVHPLVGEAEQAIYHLPLHFEHRIPRFSLSVSVVRGTHEPIVTGGLANVAFAQWEDRWVASHTMEDADLQTDFRVAIPSVPAQLVGVEPDGDAHAFVIHDSIPALTAPTQAFQPQRAQVLWDASFSRAGSHDDELALLTALLEKWPDMTVDLVVLRDRAAAPVSFDDPVDLQAHLQSMVYDGGTDLAALPLDPTADLRMLFSDGMGNVGVRPTPEAPLFTVASHSSANHLMLRSIAEESGGGHINLTTTTIEQGCAQIGPEPYSFLGLEVVSGELSEVYPRRRAVKEGRFAVSGRLHSDRADVVLLYGQGGEINARVPVQLNRQQATQTGLVPRFWAQQKVNDLSALPEPDRDALLALGRRYGIVTPGASLLVLDTLEQHIEHNVRPPATRPEMRTAWDARLQAKQQTEDDAAASHLETIVAQWAERVEWWNTDWSTRANEPPKAPETAQGFGGSPPPPEEDEEVYESAPEPEDEMASVDPIEDESVNMHRQAVLQMLGTRGEVSAATSSMSAEPASAAAPTAAGGESSGGSIMVQAWDPATPYLAALEAAAENQRAYDAYLLQRPGYQNSPAYYLDCANWFYQNGDAETGRQILTTVLDLEIDEPALLRVVAYRLAETEDLDLAVQILRQVLELRPEEPQSHRDLALMLARRGERGVGTEVEIAADFTAAMERLHTVVTQPWARFPEIGLIALMELNRLVAVTERLPRSLRRQIAYPDIDDRLQDNLTLDVRISLSWDADMTDIDLWVTEPTQEKAYYSNRLTQIGGHVSRDVTNGYGPEEYMLREAVHGEYLIQANYYGNSAQRFVGPATLKVEIFTNWGQPDEQREELTLRVDGVRDVVDAGRVSF